jgi:enoyl-CoA hydratase
MTPYSEFEHLQIAVEDGLATITFTPKDEGDVEYSFFGEFRDVFTPLSRDRAVEAVVVTGSGDVFFAGVGRARTGRLISTSHEAVAGQLLTLQQIVGQMLSFRKPVVAAVNGPAPNIGGQIALLCDAAVAAETATFGDNHVAKGVAAGDGGTMLWPLLLGMAHAREVLLQGRELTAAEALELHLVSEVVPPEQTVAAAQRLARELGALPRLPYLATKLALNNWWRLSSMLSWDLSLAFEVGGLVEPDYVAKLTGNQPG